MPRGDVRITVAPAIRGYRSDLPKHLVPEGFWVDGQNVIARNGVTQLRGGIAAITTKPSSSRVMGGFYYKDNAGTERVIVGTRVGFHLYQGVSWSDISGTALTGGVTDQVRFTSFPLSTTTRVLAVNDVDAPQVYTGTGTFAALGGSPPIAKTVTVAFQRAVLGNVTISGTRRGSSIWISDFQNPASWPAINQVDLPDTGDLIVEVRALNNQSFAIYKDRSQWIGIGSGNLFPFVFSLQSQQPGPVSPGSVVQVEEVHYYLGIDGGIYRFDGSRTMQIGHRVRQLIQNDLDFGVSGEVHGMYDQTNREIWWFWPSTSNMAGFNGISYRLPYDEIPDAFSTKHVYGLNVTASVSWRNLTSLTWSDLASYNAWTGSAFVLAFPTWSTFALRGQWGMLVGDSTGQVSIFGQSGGDQGTAIAASWESPLRALTGIGENVRVDVIESNFKATPVSVTCGITAVTSDTLGDDGTQQTVQYIDLANAMTKSFTRATYYNLVARYLGIRYSIATATAIPEYRGSTVFAYKREEA